MVTFCRTIHISISRTPRFLKTPPTRTHILQMCRKTSGRIQTELLTSAPEKGKAIWEVFAFPITDHYSGFPCRTCFNFIMKNFKHNQKEKKYYNGPLDSAPTTHDSWWSYVIYTPNSSLTWTPTFPLQSSPPPAFLTYPQSITTIIKKNFKQNTLPPIKPGKEANQTTAFIV